MLATVKRNVQWWPFIGSSMAALNAVVGAAVVHSDRAFIGWLLAHPAAVFLLFIVWVLLPLGYGALSLFSPMRLWRYVIPGANGPREFEAYLRACCERLTVLSADPDNVKIRVTLFVPEKESKLLYQVARYEWNGKTAISPTRVRWGTCDVGDAFTQRRPFQVNSIPTDGFHFALIKCGLAPDEIEAHRDKERKCFGAIPLFRDPTRQTPYKRVLYPDDEAIAVLSVDAAVADALQDDWYDRMTDLLAGLVQAMRGSKVTRHLFHAGS